MKAVLMFLLGVCLTSTYAGGIVSTLDHASLEAAIRGGGLVQITTPGTIRLTNTITISSNVTIEATVKGVVLESPSGLGFNILGVTCSLENLTVANCLNTNTTIINFAEVTLGGAIYVENGTLTLNDCIFSNNTALARSGYNRRACGGAIAGINTVVNLTNCLFIGNFSSSEGISGGSASGSGGAIYVSNSTLNVCEAGFKNNFSRATPEHRFIAITAEGGAIFGENSTLTIMRTFFSDNGTRNGGGAMFLNLGSAKLEKSIFVENRGGPFGGAISSSSTNLLVADCYFKTNSASHPFSFGQGPVNGGAIYNSGNMNVTRTTFEENLVVGAPSRMSGFPGRIDPGTPGQGGAIYNGGIVTVSSSTFLGNLAQGGADTLGSGDSGAGNGGAIFSAGTLEIQHSTFVNNNTSGAVSSGGKALFAEAGTIDIHSSIYSGNSGQLYQNSNAVVTDSGYNLSSDSSYPFPNGTNLNLRLGTFGYYGGFTPTIQLLADSPAIDFGPVAQTNSIDQRYYLRIAGERVDVGSFEYYPEGSHAPQLPTNTFSVSTKHLDSLGNVNFTNGTINTGGLLFLQATSAPSGYFFGWSGAVSKTSPELFLVTTQDVELTATFVSYLPVLQLHRSDSSINLRWRTPFTNYVLQTSSNLSNTNWQSFSTPLQESEGYFSVSLPFTNNLSFFRLIQTTDE